ncbi:MAG: DUF1232 domain-containing protein [Nitrospinae bacterium]|nr:DUF1232 domain-containing protein [Nitrospinota bacterium]
MLKRTRHLAREVHALCLAFGHKDTPLVAKIWVALALGYVFSPVDLVPDVIPVLGYLDDLLLLPLGVWVAVRLIPPAVMEECRARAEWSTPSRLLRVMGGAMVLFIWFGAMLAAGYGAWLVIGHFSG